ncbi:MAG TPA: ABC-F family ATP-binding cassette domain-containing protein [bacterium]|nr:ABC-F family ATP-binding cassette domain-containing protein [bacterium]
MLLSLSGVDFGYGADLLFRNLTFQVNAKERLGVVGPNGHGKSTLLRIVAGTLAPETGERSVRRGVDIGYLKQSQEFPEDVTVHDLLMTTFPDVIAVKRKLDAVHERMAAGDDSEATLREYGDLQHRFEELDGYGLETRADMLAEEVGFGPEDLHRPAGSLSGGERTRFELARVLLRQPELLLLDEPTNHLDLVQTERLERRLAEYPNAFLVVSHDRAFLRATCDGILEVEHQGAVRYKGGYDDWRKQRAERMRRALDEFVRQQEKVDKTEDFIRRNIAGQKTKQAQARRKMLEKMERVDRPEDVWEAAAHLGVRFDRGEHPGGREAIVARGLGIGYPGKPPLITDFDWVLHRGERVGIVGPNGSGKTSLLRVLLGRAKPVAGHAEIGYQVGVGYLDQKLQRGLDEKRSLVEEVRSLRPDLTIEGARDALASYRFLGEDVFHAVGSLSGGERCRLALLKVSLKPHNLLAFDEPTNHLDIPAVEVLERALREYDGTLLVVSHDRAFLDAVVDRILWVEDGHVHVVEGNYSEARRKMARAAAPPPEKKKPAPKNPEPPPQPAAPKGAATREQTKRLRRDRTKAQNRIKDLEADIEKFEARLEELAALLSGDPGGDWEKLNELANEDQETRARLERRYAEWERVTEKLAKLGET